jgi:hypothetical protein
MSNLSDKPARRQTGEEITEKFIRRGNVTESLQIKNKN